MTTDRYVESGFCTLDGKTYALARKAKGSSQDYERTSLLEPPFQDGAPPLDPRPQETWHLGGLKSLEGIPGTSEYGDSDGSWPLRLLPPPRRFNLVQSTPSNATSFFEALGYIFAVCGRYVYRINPTTAAVTQSKDLGVGVTGIMGLKWESAGSDIGLVTTDAAINSLWKVTAIGTPDTWVQTASVNSYRLAAGLNRLFKVTKGSILSNISSGIDPMTEGNWGDAVQVGETNTLPTGLIAYDRSVLVGKPESLFGVGEEGFGVPLIRRMVRSTLNCRGMASFDPYVLVPHSRGLFRFLPSYIESIGLEREVMNQSPVSGPITCTISDGNTLYAWVDATAGGVNTAYLLKGHEARSSEAAVGPVIWDVLMDLTCSEAPKAMYINNNVSPPRLYYSFVTGGVLWFEYIHLPENNTPPRSGGTYEFAASGTRYTNKYRFNSWLGKDFPKVAIKLKGATTNLYWTISYSIDGGGFSNLDIAGQEMSAKDDLLHYFFLPTSAVGREIQFLLTYTGAVGVNMAEVAYFEPFAVPAAKHIPELKFTVWLEENIRVGDSTETRTSAQQRADLEALSEQASSIVAKGPWGTAQAWVKSVTFDEILQEDYDEPVLAAQITMHEREST